MKENFLEEIFHFAGGGFLEAETEEERDQKHDPGAEEEKAVAVELKAADRKIEVVKDIDEQSPEHR